MKQFRGNIWAVHVLGWIVFFSLPALFIAGMSRNTGHVFHINQFSWLLFAVYIPVFYLHTFFLFPKLYFGKKYFLYFLSVALLGAAILFLKPYDRLAGFGKHSTTPHIETGDRLPPPNDKFEPVKPYRMDMPVKGMPHKKHDGPAVDIISIILFFLVVAVSITIIAIKRWRSAQELASTAEADKVKAELAILKAQIDPHFLFNTLNNIYSMAITGEEKTAESIMKLSNIMRYVIDESKKDFVSLRSETNFITDYVELQRLRLGSKVTLNFNVSGNLRDKQIAPLILITFIENVFKYGTSNREPSTITIELKSDATSISFFCRNKLFPIKQQLESTGIGIANTRKRLDYLYPGKYLLDIKEENGHHSVNLILQA